MSDAASRPMTAEQIRVCREYLEIMELILDYRKDHPNSWTLPMYDLRRYEAHMEILRVYGFGRESDTHRATGYIRKGMTPRELHEELLECRRAVDEGRMGEYGHIAPEKDK